MFIRVRRLGRPRWTAECPFDFCNLLPLGSRTRARLNLERASRDELLALAHLTRLDGNPNLFSPELARALTDHGMGNLRVLTKCRMAPVGIPADVAGWPPASRARPTGRSMRVTSWRSRVPSSSCEKPWRS